MRLYQIILVYTREWKIGYRSGYGTRVYGLISRTSFISSRGDCSDMVLAANHFFFLKVATATTSSEENAFRTKPYRFVPIWTYETGSRKWGVREVESLDFGRGEKVWLRAVASWRR